MKKTENGLKLLSILILVIFQKSAIATIIDGLTVNYDQSVDIKVNETVEGPIEISGGVVNNHGLIRANMQNDFIGDIYNYGNILIEKGVTAYNLRLFNQPNGHIVLTDYIDGYSNSIIENAGRLSIINSLGHGKTNASAGSYIPFTYIFNGSIKNTGSILIDRNNGKNICPVANSTLEVLNQGTFEVANGSFCNFGSNTYSDTIYHQYSGETRVNGTFGAHRINIQGGILSGNGTVVGDFNSVSPFLSSVLLSPGAPIGTLTLSPIDTTGMWGEKSVSCETCSIDIELANTSKADHIHVNGNLYLQRNWRLKVAVRDGYTPQPGTSFNIVSADSIVISGLAPTYDFPKVPGIKSWSIENTGSSIILTAN